MDTKRQQPLPAPTRQRLEQWIEQQQRLADLIQATVAASREELDVPPHWTIQDVNKGFIDPTPEQPAEEGEGIKG
jgi:hypothetical protein